MRRIALLLLVASSVVGLAATRPHYGGTLRVALRIAPMSLDPATGNPYDGVAARNLSYLIFDRLVTLDDRGFPQPALATSWQAEPGGQRWRFQEVVRSPAIPACLRMSSFGVWHSNSTLFSNKGCLGFL